MLRRLLLLFGLALGLSPLCHAQSGYELTCTPPYTSFPSGIATTTDFVTMKFRQWLCINPATGSVLLLDGVATPSNLDPNSLDVWVSSQCGVQPNCFLATDANVKGSKNCVITQSSTLVTGCDGAILPTDVGATFWAVYTPSKVSTYSTANGLTTIAQYNSPSSFNTTDAAIGGIGTVTLPGTWYHIDQTSVFQNANTYALSIAGSGGKYFPFQSPTFAFRPRIRIAPGNYKVNSTISDQQAGATNNIGVSIFGAGRGATQFFIGPDFHVDGNGCAFICTSNMLGVEIRDFSEFASQLNVLPSNDANFIQLSQATDPVVEHISLYGPGLANNNHDALLKIDSPSNDMYVHDNVLTGQNVGFSFFGQFCSGTVADNYFGNSRQSERYEHCGAKTTSTQGGELLISNNLGDESGVGPSHVCEDSNIHIDTGVYFGEGPAWSLDATCMLRLTGGVNIGSFNSTGNFDTFTMASGATIRASGATLRSNGTGHIFNVTGTANFFDGGNNTLLNCTNTDTCTATSAYVTGGTLNVFGSNSITGTFQTSGNISLTSGWGTSSVGTVSGDSLVEKWTVTAAGVPAASPVITVTFPTAFVKTSPICTYNQEGGNFGVITNPVITTNSTTATLTFAGTPVATQTYVMVLSCN